MKKFYITTSIVYANALPHLGFALELIQADVIARHRRLIGDDVFFLTGTDEHGLKVARKAEEEGKTPKEFCDQIANEYKRLTKTLAISNNDFIRTSDKEKHWPGIHKLWEKLKESGDIYEKNYQGLYCVGCETFVTEKDLIDGKCPYHQKEPEIVKEKNYFFRLSKYSKEIEIAIENNSIKIFPESRKNEMLSFIRKDGLKDISFSRPKEKVKWGIPVPGDEKQNIYVWADALGNYLSGIGYGRNESDFKNHWPVDIHFIGKDISKFHCLIWPGILLSAGLELPKTIFIHGFLTVDGQKMSKSLGNVVDPFDLIEKYGTSAFRYYFLREISPTEDGDFSHEKFKERYNADLASGLGNLVARVITLSDKLPEVKTEKASLELKKEVEKTWKERDEFLNDFKFNRALDSIWSLISYCDRLIDKEKPWEKSEKQLTVIGDLIFALENIARLLNPFMPGTSEKIIGQVESQKSDPLFKRMI